MASRAHCTLTLRHADTHTEKASISGNMTQVTGTALAMTSETAPECQAMEAVGFHAVL